MMQYNLIEHIWQQREWSRKTFGEGARTDTVIAHIRKELDEILQNPHDPMEWADIILLALDGAWRAGHEPEQIARAIRDKQKINEKRKWPAPNTVPEGEPIEHIRTEPTP